MKNQHHFTLVSRGLCLLLGLTLGLLMGCEPEAKSYVEGGDRIPGQSSSQSGFDDVDEPGDSSNQDEDSLDEIEAFAAGGAEPFEDEFSEEAAEPFEEEFSEEFDEEFGPDEAMNTMMSMVPETDGPNGGLGDGCRDPETGVFGYCSNTNREASSFSDCEGNNGTLVSGLCSDAAGNTDGNILCCVGYGCGPSSNPNVGICAPEAACDLAGGASAQSGLCPGGATIKCCLPDEGIAAEMQEEAN